MYRLRDSSLSSPPPHSEGTYEHGLGFSRNHVIRLYYTKDHLGSVRELVDGSGAVHARYEYSPYGERTKVAGDLDCDFGFTGHYTHNASGLVLAPYRAYDPTTDRWLSRDPIEEEGGINLYGYVGNGPVVRIDPLGLLDLDYIPTSQRDYRNAIGIAAPNAPKGAFGIEGHGDAFGLLDKNGQGISAKTLAKELLNGLGGYKKGTPIYLFSCDSGASHFLASAYAKKLAKAVGATVWSPDKLYWPGRNPEFDHGEICGKNKDGTMNRNDPGSWKRFDPK